MHKCSHDCSQCIHTGMCIQASEGGDNDILSISCIVWVSGQLMLDLTRHQGDDSSVQLCKERETSSWVPSHRALMESPCLAAPFAVPRCWKPSPSLWSCRPAAGERLITLYLQYFVVFALSKKQEHSLPHVLEHCYQYLAHWSIFLQSAETAEWCGHLKPTSPISHIS